MGNVRSLFVVLCAGAAINGTAANADAFCTFTVLNVGAGTDGTVSVALKSPSATLSYQLCNVSGSVTVNTNINTSQTVNSDTCKMIFSSLLTSRSSGSPATFWFYGANVSTCPTSDFSGIPNPYPVYIFHG